MPKHKQPLELAKLKGADKKDPQRYRNHVPKSEGKLGYPPGYLGQGARKAWRELEEITLPATITAAERYSFELLSNLMAEYRKNHLTFPVAKLTLIVNLLGKLGLTPADRQKVGIESPRKPSGSKNKFSEL